MVMKSSEKGQSLIIVAMGFVAIVAFIGFALLPPKDSHLTVPAGGRAGSREFLRYPYSSADLKASCSEQPVRVYRRHCHVVAG